MRFSKMHGIGNDFVMIADPHSELVLSPDLVRSICDRRFGIGADGVIRVAPGTEGGDLMMDYVNSDGSIGEMCGNGIRCLAIFARDEGLTDSTELKVETGAGLKVVSVLDDLRVRVDMGAPIFDAPDIPLRWDGDPLHVSLEAGGETLGAAVVSMGNPHAVIFTVFDGQPGDPDDVPLTVLGSQIEVNPLFPNKTNVEFIRVDSPEHITMRVWERGSGETLACGTGACAVGVVGRLLGGTGENVTVSLPGGDLEIEWQGALDRPASVLMTGPTARTFEGEFEIEDLQRS
ncbi:MAG: diaminopimelate epimerase [Actinobacteria bacterium]|nr:diaminopimelate epimerase [Actinomycetota bacterium]